MRLRLCLALIGISAGLAPAPAFAECEIVHCERECWAVPGGTRCQNRCLRRCWRPTPQYVPPPSYDPPRYTQPSPVYTGRDERVQRPIPIEPIIAIGGLLILCVLAIAAFASSSSIDSEIAAVEKSASSARTLAADAASKTQQIDAFITDAERDAASLGRAAADREWTGE